MDVVVIGAGVVGASIAAHLARRGADVTLVDKSRPGTGTSATSYAWVNANGKEPQSYYALNHAGVRAHHELAASGAPWLRATGHVEFAVDDAHRVDLADRVRRLISRGYRVEELDLQRARTLLSDVDVPDDAQLIAYFAEEAHLFAVRYVGAMVARARAAGASIVTGTEIVGLRGHGCGAELTAADGTVLHADIVVSAVGKWTGELAALAGLTIPVLRFAEPGDVTVGYLMETDPLPVELDRVVTTPWLNIRPAGGGRLLLQALDLDATADPRAVPSTTSPVAAEMLSRLKAVVRNTEAAVIRRVTVGERVMPADGHTIVGTVAEVPWFYVVATHSGVTLAALLGDRVAAEIYGADEPLFADFRPDRFGSSAPISAPRRPRKPGEQ